MWDSQKSQSYMEVFQVSKCSIKKQNQRSAEWCPPALHPEENLVLPCLAARFIGSSVRWCMIPSHLSPDSGVTDSDLCERRQKCQRENMCVSSHQLRSAPLRPNHIWNSKNSLTVAQQTPKTYRLTTNTHHSVYLFDKTSDILCVCVVYQYISELYFVLFAVFFIYKNRCDL